MTGSTEVSEGVPIEVIRVYVLCCSSPRAQQGRKGALKSTAETAYSNWHEVNCDGE